MERFKRVEVPEPGLIRGEMESRGERVRFEDRLDHLLIREAWDRGCDYENLADAYVAAFNLSGEMVAGGMGTRGDWSGIRDSSEEAKARMLERALNFLFGSPDGKK